MIKIYDINDNVLMQAEVTSAAKREQEMSKSDYISLSFSAAEKIILPAGAYIYHTYKIDKVREVTRKFLLLESYEPTQSDECSWKYTPQFQHPKMILSKTPFFIYTRNSQNVEVKQNVWSFVGTTSVLSGKIADFLNKDLMFGECGWKVIFLKVTANTINVSFSDNDFISALTAITNAIGDNCEWHIDYDDEIIYIGKVLIGATPVVLEVGKNVGVPSINNSKEGYYNAFSIFGGTRNITQVNSKGENVSSGDIRLQLEEGNGTITIDGKECSYSIDKYSTLDLRADKTKEPLFTKVLDFSQIYPSLNTYVYNVRGRVKYVLDENNEKIHISYNTDGSVKEYKTFTVWYMRLAYPTTEKVEGKKIINTTVDNGVTHYWYDFEITDNLLINGKNIGCSFEANFNTGALSTPLAGRGSNGEYVGFELTYHKEASSSHTSDDVSKGNFSILAGDYEIIYQEDNEVIIPTNAAEMLIPRGESMPSLKCNITVLYNIAMADTIYYEDAQNRLLEKAKEEIVRLLSDLNNYEVKSYADVFLEDNPQLQIGQSVTYKDGYGYELATRVLKLSKNIDYDFVQSITLGNQAIKGTITQLKEDVQTIIANGGNSGNGGGFSVSQLRSLIAKYGSDNFISKQFDDIAHGTITWEKVQKFLGGMDVGNNAGQWTREGVLSVFKFLTNNFEEGLYGHGAQIDENGRMEAQSLRLRGSLEAPKFVFNEVSVTKAEQWNTNGYGTIESVDSTNRTINLKLEENDYGSLSVGDICRGIFADIENFYGSDTNNEGEMDECGFTIHRGFFTTYFYVKKIITAEKGKFVFEYGKRSEGTPDPCAFMDFAQYGNFTDEQRQSSMYFCSRGRSYIEVLDGVNTWEIQAENRVTRYGWLGGLRVKKADGTWENLKGNGLFAQNNVYLGGAVITLSQIKDLDSLKLDVAAYDVTMSQPAAVITVDDLGNVINGLWSVDEAGVKQYRISTAIFARKGEDMLLLEDEKNEECTAGHYRVYAIGNGCDVKIENGAVFLTGIDKIKDGVAGSADDANFNYDDMRKISACSITIVVELEGKVTKNLEFPVRIHHDSLPFMVCDLSNENASVAWNTKTAKYIGLPVTTKVSLMYQNTPWEISDLSVGAVNGLKASISLQGKEKVITIDADNITSDILEQITKIPITVVGVYAGVSYEYTKELTILRSSDMIVYDVVPSVDSVVVDKDGNLNTKSVSCKVYATSSDDRRYALSALPSGYQLKYGYGDTADTALALGSSVTASTDHTRITFALYDNKGALLDLETVPIVSFGKDGKGIEYIFKRTTDSTPPKNPTPSNWSTNAEYLRTDKEFVPKGWTDDPTGVDAVNLYEWVSKRVSTNGHWGAFSEPAEYAHFGKHAAKATLSDYIVTIPTDSAGNTLAAFAEDVFCSLVVDGKLCSGISISADNTPAGVTLGNSLLRISYSKGYALGATSKVIKVKVSGTLDNATYSDTISLTILPNISGADGDGYEYVFYLSNSATAPSKPSRSNGKLSGGWVDDPPSPTDDNRYVYVSYYEGKVGAPNVAMGLWSTPALWAYKAPKGDKGIQGVGNVTSITISNWNEADWNNAGTYGTVWTFGSDTSSKRNGCRVDDLFTVTGTATDTRNAHTITYKSLTDSGALKGSCLSHSVAYRGEQGGSGGPGPRGTKGPIMRTHDGFETGNYNYSDGTKDTDEFIDVVIIEGKYYYCILSYSPPSPPSTPDKEHWTLGSNFDLVATKLLLAANATITMANSQQINIMTGNSLWGSFRYVDEPTDYALWLGASSGDSAPFGVKRNGYAKMANADITGRIVATSGQIAGMKISGLGLTNAGFNNDAYIILRNDNYNTFAGIGYHVAAYESGVNAVAHFSNGETKDLGEKNYAMVVNAYGADDNIAIGISGGYIEGLRVKTGMLTAGGASSNSPVNISKGIHSIMITGAGYYQLPAMEKNDDGYVLFVKNEYDGSINIVTSSGINRKGEKKDTFILFDRGDKTTNLTVYSRGDAMVFVYHRDVVQEGYDFRGGCWVQYKCPRDW